MFEKCEIGAVEKFLSRAYEHYITSPTGANVGVVSSNLSHKSRDIRETMKII